MNKFLVWSADSPIASFLRVFVSFVLAAAVADFVKAGAFDVGNFQLWVIGGIASALPPFLRFLNPQDNNGSEALKEKFYG